MNPPQGAEEQGSSTRPYLLRALHDWCTDNGFTPYIAVLVDDQVRVPMEYVKNNEIVLNIGFEATSGLKLGNEAVEFRARFGGTPRDIMVPINHVVAIYARENGQGMAFPPPTPQACVDDATAGAARPPGEQADGVPSLRLAGREPVDEAPRGGPSAGKPGVDDEPPPLPQPPAGSPRPRLKRVK